MNERAVLQRKKANVLLRAAIQQPIESSQLIPEVPSIKAILRPNSGQPLDRATRAFMEPRFGHSFADVRVHSDEQAAASAQAVSALAYTVGNHLVFGAGQYAPGTSSGHQLLAHELTHVVQQRQGPVAGISLADGLAISEPGNPYEQAADQMAAQVLHSESAASNAGVGAATSATTVQRMTIPGLHHHTVQRSFWDDDEEEQATDDDGSSEGVIDTLYNAGSAAVDTASEAGDAAVDWAAETGGAAVDTASETADSGVDWATETGGTVADAVGDTADSAIDSATETGEAAMDVVSDAGETIAGWVTEMGDAAGDEDTDDNTINITAECDADEENTFLGKGQSKNRKINLHGTTTLSGLDHGQPRPPQLPSNAVIQTIKRGKQTLIHATGSLPVEYNALVLIKLPSVPDGLTPCQAQAARDFINGTLNDHELAHSAALNQYNGKVSLPFDFTVPASLVTRALTNVMNAEDQRRANKAKADSAKLDPFVRDIPGLDCQD